MCKTSAGRDILYIWSDQNIWLKMKQSSLEIVSCNIAPSSSRYINIISNNICVPFKCEIRLKKTRSNAIDGISARGLQLKCELNLYGQLRSNRNNQMKSVCVCVCTMSANGSNTNKKINIRFTFFVHLPRFRWWIRVWGRFHMNENDLCAHVSVWCDLLCKQEISKPSPSAHAKTKHT